MGILDEVQRRWKQANTPIDHTWNGSHEDYEDVEEAPYALGSLLGFHAGYQGLNAATQGLADFYNKPLPQGSNAIPSKFGKALYNFKDATQNYGRPIANGLNYMAKNMFIHPKVSELPLEYGYEYGKPVLENTLKPAIQQLPSSTSAIGNVVNKYPTVIRPLVRASMPLFTASNMGKLFYNSIGVPAINTALFFGANATALGLPILAGSQGFESKVPDVAYSKPEVRNAPQSEEEAEAREAEAVEKATKFANEYLEADLTGEGEEREESQKDEWRREKIELDNYIVREEEPEPPVREDPPTKAEPKEDPVVKAMRPFLEQGDDETVNEINESKPSIDLRPSTQEEAMQNYMLNTMMDKYKYMSAIDFYQHLSESNGLLKYLGQQPLAETEETRNMLKEQAREKYLKDTEAYYELMKDVRYDP